MESNPFMSREVPLPSLSLPFGSIPATSPRTNLCTSICTSPCTSPRNSYSDAVPEIDLISIPIISPTTDSKASPLAQFPCTDEVSVVPEIINSMPCSSQPLTAPSQYILDQSSLSSLLSTPTLYTTPDERSYPSPLDANASFPSCNPTKKKKVKKTYQNCPRRREQISRACKKHRDQKKRMVSELKLRLTELSIYLEKLKISKGMYAQSSLMGMSSENESSLDHHMWKQESLIQKRRVQLALQDNLKLREAVQEQMKFNRQMASFIFKQPKHNKMTEVLQDSWCFFSLRNEAQDLRRKAMVSLADHQMEMLSGLLLETDLYGTTEKKFKRDKIRHSNGVIEQVDVARQALLENSDMKSVQEASRSFVNSEVVIHNPYMEKKTLEIVDRDCVYCQFLFQAGNVTYISRVVMKKYTFKDREVIVWRSVLEDEKYTSDDKSTVIGDESGWIVVNTKDNNVCNRSNVTLKILLQLRPPVGMKGKISLDPTGLLSKISPIIDSIESLLDCAILMFDDATLNELQRHIVFGGCTIRKCILPLMITSTGTYPAL